MEKNQELSKSYSEQCVFLVEPCTWTLQCKLSSTIKKSLECKLLPSTPHHLPQPLLLWSSAWADNHTMDLKLHSCPYKFHVYVPALDVFHWDLLGSQRQRTASQSALEFFCSTHRMWESLPFLQDVPHKVWFSENSNGGSPRNMLVSAFTALLIEVLHKILLTK